MINVLIVDDHLAVREGTKAIINSVEGYQATCFEPPYATNRIVAYEFSGVDLVLMDLNLGDDDCNGMHLSQAILNKHPEMKIILYTGYDVSDYWDEAIRMGIYGVVTKSDSKEKIMNYIQNVLDGNIVVNFKEFQQSKLKAEEVTTSSQSSSQENLITEREKQILIEVEKGLTNQEIADKLHLSKRSIEYSLTNIYGKFNIGTRTEAVLMAKSYGYID